VSCPFCEQSFTDSDVSFWLIDMIDGELVVLPCCESMAVLIEENGFEAAIGRSIASITMELGW